VLNSVSEQAVNGLHIDDLEFRLRVYSVRLLIFMTEVTGSQLSSWGWLSLILVGYIRSRCN